MVTLFGGGSISPSGGQGKPEKIRQYTGLMRKEDQIFWQGKCLLYSYCRHN